MKAWYTLFAHAQLDFNYNDVTFIYDKMYDIGVIKVSMDSYLWEYSAARAASSSHGYQKNDAD